MLHFPIPRHNKVLLYLSPVCRIGYILRGEIEGECNLPTIAKFLFARSFFF